MPETLIYWFGYQVNGHTGIRGKRADEAAKAALSSTVSTMKCPASDFIPELTMHYREVWQNGMDALLINCTLSNLTLATVASHISLVVMLLFWEDYAFVHTRVTHKYLLSGDSQPLCDKCKCCQTVKNILLECCCPKHVCENYFTCSSLKNYLRMLMQQQLWILSKRSTFIIFFSHYCYVSILH